MRLLALGGLWLAGCGGLSVIDRRLPRALKLELDERLETQGPRTSASQRYAPGLASRPSEPPSVAVQG